MKREYAYVEIHGSGFPLRTVPCGADRADAINQANTAYWRAVNTECAHGIRFGVVKTTGSVNGKTHMTRLHRKFIGKEGPFT